VTARSNAKGGSEAEAEIGESKIEDSFAAEVEDESFSGDLQGSMTTDAGERGQVDGATGTQDVGAASVQEEKKDAQE